MEKYFILTMSMTFHHKFEKLLASFHFMQMILKVADTKVALEKSAF